jgi:hypothetical protein
VVVGPHARYRESQLFHRPLLVKLIVQGVNGKGAEVGPLPRPCGFQNTVQDG